MKRAMFRMLVLVLLAAPAMSQWRYIDTSVDGMTRVETYREYTVHADGDVEVWLRISTPYYGRWRPVGRMLTRFNCITYGAFYVKYLSSTGRALPIARFEASQSGTLIREAAVAICDANAAGEVPWGGLNDPGRH